MFDNSRITGFVTIKITCNPLYMYDIIRCQTNLYFHLVLGHSDLYSVEANKKIGGTHDY